MNKKEKIIIAIVFVLVGVISFGVTYIIRSKQIDEEFANAFQSNENLPEITSYTIYLDDNEYYNIAQLIGVVEEPVTLDMKVTYSDGTTIDRQGYVSFNTDNTVYEAYMKDGDYIQIVLPDKDLDIPSFNEFLDETGVTDKVYKQEEK